MPRCPQPPFAYSPAGTVRRRLVLLLLSCALGWADDPRAAHASVDVPSTTGSSALAQPHGPTPPPGGQIAGALFDDLDADGVQNGLDAPLAGVTVYLDLDGDGVLDPGEPTAITDAGGAYLFEDVPSATYTVRPAIAPGVLTTTPAIAPQGAGNLTFVDQIRDEDGNVHLTLPSGVVVSPDDQNVYAGSHETVLTVFFRDAGGEWTFDPSGTLAVGSGDLAISRDGLFVYALGEPDALTVLAREATTGRLTVVEVFQDAGVSAGNQIPGATLVAGLRSSTQFEAAVEISADDQFVYTASRTDDTVLVFSRDATAGTLTLLQTLTDGTLSDNGATPDRLNGAKDLVASPDDAHVYVVAMDEPASGGNAGSLTVLGRDGATGMLTQLQAVQTGAFLQIGVTISADGATVYEATRSSGLNGRLDVFLRDADPASPTFGQLAHVQTLANGAGGVEGIAGAIGPTVSADGKSVYLASLTSATLTGFARDADPASPTFGRLTPEQVFQDDTPFGTPVDGATVVGGLFFALRAVVGPTDGEVFVVASSDHALTTFDRDPDTGLLIHGQTLKDGQGGTNGLSSPVQILVAPDGAHAYIPSRLDDAVLVMERDPATGVLSVLETYQDPDIFDVIPFTNVVDGLNDVTSGALSPDGRFLYVTGEDDDALVVFSRNPATGALTVVQTLQDAENADPIDGATPLGSLAAVRDLQLSPDGRHAYVRTDDGPVVVLARDTATGLLGFVQTVTNGFGPMGEAAVPRTLTFSPDGAHAYVDSSGAGITSHLAVFSRDAATGMLTPVGLVDPVPGNDFFAGSAQVTFAPGGVAAFVFEALRPDTPVYLRDPATGLLAFDHVESGLANPPIFSPDGFFAFVFDTSGPDVVVDVFAHDPVNCVLTFSHTITDDVDGLFGVTFSPDAAHAYSLIGDGFRVFAHDGGPALPGTHRVFLADGQAVVGRDFGLHFNTVALAATQPDAAEAGPVAGQITLTRAGDTTLALPVHYTVGGTAKNGIDYATIAAPTVIPAGQGSATVDILPADDDEAEGAETVILTLAATPGYRLAAGPTSAAVTIADDDGTSVAFDRPIVFTDPDGTTVTLTAKNASGTALFTGDAVQIAVGDRATTVSGGSLALASVQLTDVVAAAVLAIKTRRGDGRVTVRNIRVDGALKTLKAKTTDLADGGALFIGGGLANKAVKIELGILTNATVISATPIAKLTLERWLDLDPDVAPDSLTAPWVGTIATKDGAFMAGLVVSGGDAPKGIAVKSVKIKGPLGSGDAAHPAVWSVTGDARAIAAAAVDGWTLQLMSSLTTLKIKGDVDGATLTLTQAVGDQPAAKSIKAGGVIRNTLIESAGNVDKLEAAALHESVVRLGVAGAVAGNTLPAVAGDLTAQAVLKSLKLKGIRGSAAPAFRASIVAAAHARKLRLGPVESANGGIPFGVAVGAFDAIEYVLDGIKTKLKTPADIGAEPIAGDFIVRVL